MSNAAHPQRTPLIRDVLIPQQIVGDPPPWGQVQHDLQGLSMGTNWSVRFYGPHGLALAPLQQSLQALLDEVVAEMSPWAPSSALSRYNRAQAGSRHVLPAGFARVLDAALQVAEASGGAFDPCAGQLVNRWGFGPGIDLQTPGYRSPGFVPPDDRALVDAQGTGPTAWAGLNWQRDSLRVTQPGGLSLDLCAIAKGDAVDRLSRHLSETGHPHHLVEVGGELRGAGLKPDGHPWWVALEPPDANLNPQTRCWADAHIALHGLAVATSGDYRRCYTDAQGRWRSHTIDPRSGQPIAHGVASVSVLHEEALWADAWSTALLVLGTEAGLALASRLKLAARWLQRPEPLDGHSDWRCVESPAWLALKDDAPGHSNPRGQPA
ncbi:FAD:protein FMN transferase [Ideonella sp.]|uniref:FAD:protein FMN transferase n=1 Tax=Ideonella sp. TaxID=1929293 RepID=UPI003BB58AAD